MDSRPGRTEFCLHLPVLSEDGSDGEGMSDESMGDESMGDEGPREAFGDTKLA